MIFHLFWAFKREFTQFPRSQTSSKCREDRFKIAEDKFASFSQLMFFLGHYSRMAIRHNHKFGRVGKQSMSFNWNDNINQIPCFHGNSSN